METTNTTTESATIDLCGNCGHKLNKICGVYGHSNTSIEDDSVLGISMRCKIDGCTCEHPIKEEQKHGVYSDDDGFFKAQSSSERGVSDDDDIQHKQETRRDGPRHGQLRQGVSKPRGSNRRNTKRTGGFARHGKKSQRAVKRTKPSVAVKRGRVGKKKQARSKKA